MQFKLNEHIYLGDILIRKGSILKVANAYGFKIGWFFNTETNKFYEVPSGITHKEWLLQPGTAKKIGLDSPKYASILIPWAGEFRVDESDPYYSEWESFMYNDGVIEFDLINALDIKDFKKLYKEYFGFAFDDSDAFALSDKLPLIKVRLYNFGLLTFSNYNAKCIKLFIDTLFDENEKYIKKVNIEGKSFTVNEFLMYEDRKPLELQLEKGA